MKVVDPEKEVAFDEALYGFFSSHHEPHTDNSCKMCREGMEPCPQRYIPRKPHPNGLLAYHGGIKMMGLPYIVWILPDCNAVWKVNPRDAAAAMVRDFSKFYGHSPHVTMDAGFSGTDLIDLLTSLRCAFTLSLNVAHFRKVFIGLSYFCPLKNWLAVRDPKGRVWSLMKGGGKTEHTSW